MGNNMQKWRKTRANWEIRKIIWERWALGDTERDTVIFFESNSEKYPNGPLHRHTINKVRKELLNLPVTLLNKLASELPELLDFLKEIRSDYNGQVTALTGTPTEHVVEYTVTLLTIASNLEKYRNEPFAFLGTEMDKVWDRVYGGWWIGDERAKLGDVDRKIAADILQHLKVEGEFPELTDIRNWSELNDTQITENFIQRLIAKAHMGNF